MITHPVLSALAVRGVKLGLDEVADFLDFVGAPHRAAPVLHVAGTNGKGSVVAMLDASLRAAGLRVAATISPHLEHLNERVRIDGVPVDDDALEAGIAWLDDARHRYAEARGLPEAPLTYFEFTTVLFFHLAAEAGVDAMVVEVGLGGRLDATNVVQPASCGITHVGLDHREILGHTLGAIATEKAGILKTGVPAMIGPMDHEAAQAIAHVAGRVGARLWWLGLDVDVRPGTEDGTWTFVTPGGTVADVRLALQGVHQVGNAAVAVGMLHRCGVDVDDDAIRQGLQTAVHPGRLERIAPDLVLDGAHNADGARALAAWLATQPRPARRVLLFGQGSDRVPHEVVEPLLDHVDAIVTTACAHPKARDPDALVEALVPLGWPVTSGGPIEDALPAARVDADEVIVAGSLFVVGAVRALVAPA